MESILGCDTLASTSVVGGRDRHTYAQTYIQRKAAKAQNIFKAWVLVGAFYKIYLHRPLRPPAFQEVRDHSCS